MADGMSLGGDGDIPQNKGSRLSQSMEIGS